MDYLEVAEDTKMVDYMGCEEHEGQGDGSRLSKIQEIDEGECQDVLKLVDHHFQTLSSVT